MIYLLDANVILHLANRAQGHENIRAKLKSLPKSRVAISAITAVELWEKVLNAKVSRRANSETAALLNTIRIFAFKADAASYGGLLLQTSREKGKPVGWPDTMLAAHALSLDAIVVTDNTKDFKARGCKFENWRTA